MFNLIKKLLSSTKVDNKHKSVEIECVMWTIIDWESTDKSNLIEDMLNLMTYDQVMEIKRQQKIDTISEQKYVAQS